MPPFLQDYMDITPVTEIVVEQRIITTTPLPTYTLPPTLAGTPLPPTPSPTSPPQYYEQGSSAELKPGVTLTMWDRFPNQGFIGCWASGMGYPAVSIALKVRNSSAQQFSLRFEPDTFSVTDNLGRNYKVRGSGLGGCPNDPDLRSTILNSRQEADIFILFEGEIGVDVQYFIVTVGNISGSGPWEFRKDV